MQLTTATHCRKPGHPLQFPLSVATYIISYFNHIINYRHFHAFAKKVDPDQASSIEEKL